MNALASKLHFCNVLFHFIVQVNILSASNRGFSVLLPTYRYIIRSMIICQSLRPGYTMLYKPYTLYTIPSPDRSRVGTRVNTSRLIYSLCIFSILKNGIQEMHASYLIHVIFILNTAFIFSDFS